MMKKFKGSLSGISYVELCACLYFLVWLARPQ